MMCDDNDDFGEYHPRATSTTFFEQRNSLGNDYCPHSSRLFPLVEQTDDDDELSSTMMSSSSSLRKQTAVTCLAALDEATGMIDCDLSGNHSSGNSSHGGSDFAHPATGFGALLSSTAIQGGLEDEEDEDDASWGHFAHHHHAEFAQSTSIHQNHHHHRLPTRRRRPHQRRRSPAKYDRHGVMILTTSSNSRRF